MAERQEEVRAFILEHIEEHPTDIARLVQNEFSISRQAAHKYLRHLRDEGVLESSGHTNSTSYALVQTKQHLLFQLSPDLEEDVVWREQVAPSLRHLNSSARKIWHYAFTEMFNNAVDHSDGARLHVFITHSHTRTQIALLDDGVGIFKKIQRALSLEDQRHAVLELAKGKLTTDPSKHSGEGIFFTSRVLDEFAVMSGEVSYSHGSDSPEEDWVFEREEQSVGTTVVMELLNLTDRTLKEVFNMYASDEDLRFNKTVIPVELAKIGSDDLVSRSQAKRLLARVDKFKTVLLDFSNIDTIGQAFADQVFRVFQNEHPEIEIVPINTAPDVEKMIARAKAHTP